MFQQHEKDKIAKSVKLRNRAFV